MLFHSERTPRAPAEAIIQLRGSKLGLGAILPDGHFRFNVRDESGAEVTSGYNRANGDIEFDEFVLFAAGVYHYTIEEDPSNNDPKWITDTSRYRVIVTVIQDPTAAHGFRVEIEYPDGFPIFKDFYCDSEGGLVEFPCINFTHPGVYRFTIRENTEPKPGWVLDDSEFEVIVTVTDDGEGNLIPHIEYPDGFPTFENRYKANAVCVPLSAFKIVIGAELQKGQFTFNVYDEEGNIVATATNEAPCDRI